MGNNVSAEDEERAVAFLNKHLEKSCSSLVQKELTKQSTFSMKKNSTEMNEAGVDKVESEDGGSVYHSENEAGLESSEDREEINVLRERIKQEQRNTMREKNNALESEFERRQQDISNKFLIAEQCRQLETMRINNEKLLKQVKVDNNQRYVGSVHEVAEVLPNFDPDGVLTSEEWVEKVESCVDSFEISEKMLMMALQSKMQGVAKRWFMTHVRQGDGWAEAKEKIIKAFAKQRSIYKLSLKINNTKRLPGEELLDYFVKIESMADGKFTDEDLVYAIMTGSNHRTLIQMAELGSKLTSLELWEKIREMSEMRNTRGGIKVTAEAKGIEVGNVQKCFKCNGEGHYARSCPMMKPTSDVLCFKCRNKGHTADKCTGSTVCAFCRKQGHFQWECELKRVDMGRGGARFGESDRHIKCIESDNVQGGAVRKQQNRQQLRVDERSRVQARLVLDDHERELNTLVDTGSAVSAIQNCIFSKCQGLVKNYNSKNRIRGINGSEVRVLGSFKSSLSIDKNNFKVDFLVVPRETMSDDAILGMDFLNKNNIKVIKIGSENSELEGKLDEGWDELNKILRSEVGDTGMDKLLDELEVGDTKETRGLRETIQSLVVSNYLDYKTVSRPVTSEVKIRLKDDIPMHVKPKRMSAGEGKIVKEKVEEMLREGIIRDSESEYSSRVLLVKKKDGDSRMCVDYRELNKKIFKDRYPMPVIEDLVQKLFGKKYFTALDLKNGFYHVDIEPKSRRYTAFVKPNGQYEFNKLPFGFANAPAAFARYLNKVLRSFINSGDVLIFMDDILIATESIGKHIDILGELLKELAESKVKLKFSKCSWVREKIEFLGLTVSSEGVAPNDRHVDAIKEYPCPVDVKGVQRFLGLVGYFRRFIKDFKELAAPLQNIVRLQNFVWEKEQYKAFEMLRGELMKKPILGIFSPDLETELHTDASANGFGAILFQRNKGSLYPVSFFSKRSNAVEQRMHSFELETLAVLYSLKRFRHYLVGKKFKLITDCNAMKQTLAKRDLNAKIERWALAFEEFDFETEHRAGDRMQHVDALSRIYMTTLNEELEESEEDNRDRWKLKLILAQAEDKEIVTTIEKVGLGEKKGYAVREGVLYRQDGKRLQLVVPEKMIGSLIFKMHDGMGHMGTKKTCSNIRKKFYFALMRSRVEEHIAGCLSCLVFNPKTGRKEARLNMYKREPIPFHTVHVDHVGPLEKSKKGFEHILVVVDAFTKFTRLYPTKSTDTAEIVKALKDYGRAYGYPKRVVTDKGTGFAASKFKEWAREEGIVHVETGVACPWANGQVERFNRTFIPVLAKLVDEEKKEWPMLLEKVEKVLNNMYSGTTKETPTKLLFGTETSMPNKMEIEEWMDIVNKYLNKTREQSRESAESEIEKLQRYNKEYYDKRVVKERKYEKGDLVMLKARKSVGKRSKLFGKFKGPFIVKKVLDMSRYLVTDLPGWQVGRRKYKAIVDSTRMKFYGKLDVRWRFDEDRDILVDLENIESEDELE